MLEPRHESQTDMNSATAEKPKLILRNADIADAPAMAALSRRVYGDAQGSTEDALRGQINQFAEGQFIAEFEGEIVGFCSTFIVKEELALKPHTWMEITGGGFASRHDPDGDFLYGMEVTVDPSRRRLRIGQRFYRLRRDLCRQWELKGIAFGGRMPGYARREKEFPDPLDYLSAVSEKKVKDPVVNFHLAQGFEVAGVLPGYQAGDRDSRDYAALMIWRNPLAPGPGAAKAVRPGSRLPETVRVAAVQFRMRRIASLEDFEEQVEFFVDTAADYGADFVTFPEMFTLALLSLDEKNLAPTVAIAKVAEYRDRFCAFMEKLAVSYNINIIGGTHPTKKSNGDIHNVCYVFLRNGSVFAQEKLHPTPTEATWWNIKGGDGAAVINTDCGPIGVMICYDSEFPEVARHLIDQGAMILFVPFCTDERRGYLRVRYCCQARAVENQCYMVLSGIVGNLPNVENMGIHYAESCIMTPSDFPFARDGIAADTPAGTETVAVADLSLKDLLTARQQGSVQNLKDRRFDLYTVRWANHPKGEDA